jgi:1-deoxy-D-xylulose-5-phosphate reductoisomerase
VLNAANEIAVQAFLDGELSFNGIADVIGQALEAIPVRPVGHFSDLYKADAAAREQAAELIHGVTA